MVVRIRITKDPRVDGFIVGVASLLTLTAVACLILGAWKIFSELGWAGAFFLADGTFSHWQVWLALGILAQLVSFRLNRRFARSRLSTL
jgi:hypothetical protein